MTLMMASIPSNVASITHADGVSMDITVEPIHKLNTHSDSIEVNILCHYENFPQIKRFDSGRIYLVAESDHDVTCEGCLKFLHS